PDLDEEGLLKSDFCQGQQTSNVPVLQCHLQQPSFILYRCRQRILVSHKTPFTWPEPEQVVPTSTEVVSRPITTPAPALKVSLISPSRVALGGRTRLFLDNWSSLTSDQQFLETVAGFHLEFFVNLKTDGLTASYPFFTTRSSFYSASSPTIVTQRHNCSVSATPFRLLQQYFYSKQERWRVTPRDQSEGVEYLDSIPALQDGRDPSAQGHSQGRRLDGTLRPE
ncbi:hypothetical protein NDU88_001846, partial [Pleurodeles waltl]